MNMEPGRSLVRLGYPFGQVKTTFDEATRTFMVSGSMPFFPLDPTAGGMGEGHRRPGHLCASRLAGHPVAT